MECGICKLQFENRNLKLKTRKSKLEIGKATIWRVVSISLFQFGQCINVLFKVWICQLPVFNLQFVNCKLKDYKELWMGCQAKSMIFSGTRFNHELANLQIMCGAGQALSYLEKTAANFKYKCAHIAGLGVCREGWMRQMDTSSGSVSYLAGLGVTCVDKSETPNLGLQR